MADGPEFEQVLTTAASWVLVACAAWALLIALALAVEAVTAGRCRAAAWVCPPRLRSALLAGLGLALVTGTPTGATTAPASRGAAGHGPPAPTGARTLPVPDRAVEAVRVRAGDTLWALATDHVTGSAAPARVLAAVGRLHRLNRDVVGPDPDLIRPGQRLLLPLEEEP